MAIANIVKLAKDALGNTFNYAFRDLNGDGSVLAPRHSVVGLDGSDIDPAKDASVQSVATSLGADGATPPSIAGTGVRGWLRAIFEKLAAGSGLGALAAVPAGTTNGAALGVFPAGAKGVRFYLPTGASVTFTVAAAAPTSAPAQTFTISQANTGPNWDESLSNGQMIYITASTGSPLFRWF